VKKIAADARMKNKKEEHDFSYLRIIPFARSAALREKMRF